MKKVLFAIAALALCMTANAKYWFSGSIGFDNLSLYTTTDKAKTLDFSPAFGMEIEDDIELGIQLGIVDDHYYRGGGVQQEFSFSFAPFIRYTFLREGDFNMFVEGGFDYTIISPSGYNFWSIAFKIEPGIRYNFSEHWSAVAKCKGFSFTHMSEPEQAGWPGEAFKNKISLGIDTALQLGLVYEF
jgi:hypothetical protein